MRIRIKIPYISDDLQLARLCFITVGSILFGLEFGLIVGIGTFFIVLGMLPYGEKEK